MGDAYAEKRAVIFDLGNTLVAYYTRKEWPDILARAIDDVSAYLEDRGLFRVASDELGERVEAERSEPPDHRVKPLEGRLARIYGLTSDEVDDGVAMGMCRAFMTRSFEISRRYDDSLPALAAIRAAGMRIGILSNTPWGSPAELWREEVARHDLPDAVDAVMFCCDIGYRKPASHGFRAIMQELGVSADQCVFVGDDPRWDIVGPNAVGMDAILIDRDGVLIDRDGVAGAGATCTIRNLSELLDLLGASFSVGSMPTGTEGSTD